MNYTWLTCCTLFYLHGIEIPLSNDGQINNMNNNESDKQILFQTIVNQQLTPSEENPRRFFGKRLNAYLNNLDTKTFKEVFPKLPLRARLMYMLTIDIIEYELFLDRYNNDEWTHYWLDLPGEEKKYIPRTRVEQLCLVRDAYYNYLHRNSYFPSFFDPKSPYPNDLAELKKRCHIDGNLPTMRNDMHIFAQNEKNAFLHMYLFRKRYELFNL